MPWYGHGESQRHAVNQARPVARPACARGPHHPLLQQRVERLDVDPNAGGRAAPSSSQPSCVRIFGAHALQSPWQPPPRPSEAVAGGFFISFPRILPLSRGTSCRAPPRDAMSSRSRPTAMQDSATGASAHLCRWLWQLIDPPLPGRLRSVNGLPDYRTDMRFDAGAVLG